MNLSAKAYISYLEKNDLVYQVDEKEGTTMVVCTMQAKNTPVRVQVFVDDDNTHVAIRSFAFAKATQDKFANALLTCNKCNIEYRWVKFTVDDDLDINAEDDAVVSPDTAGEEIFELFVRMMGIVDEVFPQFMRAIWA